MNILSMIREQLSPDLLGQISKTIGESPEGTKSALEQSLPALLGSAAAEASSPQGATELFNSLKQAVSQQGSPASGSGLLGGLGSGGGAGTPFISSLLGSKMNLVRDFIANRSGVKSESASSLLHIGGQLLMGVLGKQIVSQGLGASGFGQLLRSQIPHIQGLLPPELTKMLGIGNLFSFADQTAQPGAYATASRQEPVGAGVHEVSSASKALRWALIPIVLLLLAAFFIYRNNRSASQGGAQDRTWTARDTGAGTVVSGADISGFADRIKVAVADGTPVDLQSATFDSSGNLSAEAKAPLAAVANVLNENPKLSATITAYGKTSDEATARADTIKSGLTRAGVSSDRIAVQPEVGEGPPKISFAK